MVDGISDLWITRQVSRAVKESLSQQDPIDVDFREE